MGRPPDAAIGAAQAAEDALSRCDWPAALELLHVEPRPDAFGEARRLDQLGEALWWLGRLEACIEARQAAYELYETCGHAPNAGQVAIWMYEHHCFMNRPSMASGWLRRARRQLEGHRDTAQWGNLLLREGETAHGRGDLDQAIDNATTALALGRRLRAPSLEGEALQMLGRVLIDQGHVADGFAHLDEAMLLAVEGRLSAYATGKVYCSLIGACEDLGDLRRAAEWTEATTRWSEQHPFAIFPGLCRMKRAGVLQWRGEWDEAEREARRACEELAESKVGSAGTAWCEVGEIRRRLGDLDGAEAAFAHAERLGCAPSSGIALLRLAQGRIDAAIAIIDGALAQHTWNRLARARLLPAKVQIAVAAGDVAAASAAATELSETAATWATTTLRATAELADGRARLACGEHAAASRALRAAAGLWHELDVPYEAATAELLLGQCCREMGDRETAAALLASAKETFRRLGVVDDELSEPAVPARRSLPCGLTAREVEVLRLVADGRTNRSAAVALGLSEKTIARHLENIFLKVNVSSRAGATAFAFTHGLLERSP